MIFQIQPFSGHIKKAITEVHAIAKLSPEHHFELKFNDKRMTIDPRESVDWHIESWQSRFMVEF